MRRHCRTCGVFAGSRFCETFLSGHLKRSHVLSVPAKTRSTKRCSLEVRTRLKPWSLLASTLFSTGEHLVRRCSRSFFSGRSRLHFPKLSSRINNRLVSERKLCTITTALTHYKRCVPQGHFADSAVILSGCSSDMNINFNANKFYAKIASQKLAGKQSKTKSKGRNVARALRRPKLQQRERPKHAKHRLPGRSAKQCKRISSIRRTCTKARCDENGRGRTSQVPTRHPRFTKPDSTRLSESEILGACLVNQPPVSCKNDCGVDENVLSDKRPGSCVKSLSAKRKWARQNRHKHPKMEALLKMFVINPKNGSCIDNATKHRFRYSRPSKWQRDCEDDDIVNVSQGRSVWQNCIFPPTSAESKEWPTLSEVERSKVLAHETAEQFVWSTQPRLVATATRKLVDGDAFTATEDDSSHPGTPYCSWGNQQTGLINSELGVMNKAASQCGVTMRTSSRRTWASVAAQANDALCHVPSVSLRDPVEPCSNEKALKCKPGSTEPFTKKLNQKQKSRAACSDRTWPYFNKATDKLNLHKYFGECEMRKMKHRTTHGYRKRTQDREQPGRKLSLWRDNGVSKRKEIFGERSSNGDSSLQLAIDEMPVIYTQPAGSMFCLNESAEIQCHLPPEVSHCISNLETLPTVADTERLHNSGLATDDMNGRVNYNSVNGSQTYPKPLKIPNKILGRLSDYRVKPECRAPVICRQCHLKFKGQRSAPVHEQEAIKQKKISSKFRALLRCERGHLDAKTVVEIEARSKRWENLDHDKIMNRAELCRKRHDRYRTHHNSQRSTTFHPTFDSHQSLDSEPSTALEPTFDSHGSTVLQPTSNTQPSTAVQSTPSSQKITAIQSAFSCNNSNPEAAASVARMFCLTPDFWSSTPSKTGTADSETWCSSKTKMTPLMDITSFHSA